MPWAAHGPAAGPRHPVSAGCCKAAPSAGAPRTSLPAIARRRYLARRHVRAVPNSCPTDLARDGSACKEVAVYVQLTTDMER
jgi:hypothetical protein